jgi:asparagine synthase (glutamine-hydrolysing)
VEIGWRDMEEFLPELIHHQDEPIADWVCVPLHFVSKLARDNGTVVVQVGEGSDELFHGYQGYVDYARITRDYWRPARQLPPTLLQVAGRAVTGLGRAVGRGERYGEILLETAEGRVPFWGGAIAWRGGMKDRLLMNGHHRGDSYVDVVHRLWEEAGTQLPGADLLQRMTYLELKQRLAELLLMRVDKMTMATSVEARVPFLDHELVEFAMALPQHMKVRDGTGKYILKKAVEGLLPDHIVHRRKQGFGAPVEEWFRGDLGVRAQRQIRESSLAERGVIDLDEIDKLWNRHRAGRGEWGFWLWNIYNVAAWHDYWVAGRALA